MRREATGLSRPSESDINSRWQRKSELLRFYRWLLYTGGPYSYGARVGNRTRTLPHGWAAGFKPDASTNFATRAS